MSLFVFRTNRYPGYVLQYLVVSRDLLRNTALGTACGGHRVQYESAMSGFQPFFAVKRST